MSFSHARVQKNDLNARSVVEILTEVLAARGASLPAHSMFYR
jgi:hypothetical protein